MAKNKKPMKGVSCSVRKGVEYWYARIDGQKKYCGAGNKGREIAIAAKAKDIAVKFEKRELSAGLATKRIRLKTVLDLSNWYMTLPKIQKQASYRRKTFSAAHLLKYFGKRPVATVKADDIEAYRDQRKALDIANGTINLEVQLLRAMYRLAVKREQITAEAVPGEFVMVLEQNPRRVITDDEYARLLKHADADFKDILVCASESAMRAGEIGGLTAGQVHLDIQHISGNMVDYIDLGVFDTKTKTRRTVPVSPELKEILQRRIEGLDPDDRVFTHTKAGRVCSYSYQNIRATMRWLCKKADVVYGDRVVNAKGERIGIVFHCFRHTRTTKWVEMGFSDEIIRRATGHKTLEAYRVYVKLDPSVVMRLVERELKTDKNGTKSLQSTVN